MTTAADIVNQALQDIGAQATVSGNNPAFDGSAMGNYAGILYTPAMLFLLRQQDWEFAFNQEPLVLTGSAAPTPWSFEYVFPDDCVKVRSIYPPAWDANDPQAVRWSFKAGIVSGVEKRLILCNVQNAALAYTTSTVTENMFTNDFREAFVRLLASELAMAAAGRPDFATKLLEWSGGIASEGPGRDS